MPTGFNFQASERGCHIDAQIVLLGLIGMSLHSLLTGWLHPD